MRRPLQGRSACLQETAHSLYQAQGFIAHHREWLTHDIPRDKDQASILIVESFTTSLLTRKEPQVGL